METVAAVEPTPPKTETKAPTEKPAKIPFRAPRGKPDPGQSAVQTLGQGCVAIFFFLVAFLFISFDDGVFVGMGVVLLLLGVLGILLAARSLNNSRGGW